MWILSVGTLVSDRKTAGSSMSLAPWMWPMKRSILAAIPCMLLSACGGEGTTPFSPSAFPGATVSAGSGAGEFDWSGAIAEGLSLEIRGVIGDVRATPAAGRIARVSTSVHAQHSDPSQVRVEVVEHAFGITICAIYPSPDGAPANACLPGDAGQSSINPGDFNDVRVDFTVSVPPGVVFLGRTVWGDIESTAAIAEASTFSGSVHASIGSGDWGRDLEFSTFSGDVTVEVFEAVNANVRLSTFRGRIVSDFPLKFAPQGLDATGTLGAGGKQLTLSTFSGNVSLRRRP